MRARSQPGAAPAWQLGRGSSFGNQDTAGGLVACVLPSAATRVCMSVALGGGHRYRRRR